MVKIVGSLDIPEAQSGTPASGGERFSVDPTNTANKLFVRNSAGVLVPAGFGSPMTTQDDIIIAGASGAPARLAKGANGTYLGVDGTGHVAYSVPPTGTPASVIRLDYNPTTGTELLNGVTVGSATTNIGSSQNFTVGQVGSLICVSCPGSMLFGNATQGARGEIRALIDGTTAYKLGEVMIQTSGAWANPFGSGGPIWMSGLSAGTHTIQLQIVTYDAGNTLYLRQTGAASYEWLHLMVTEIAAGGPVGATGPTGATGATGASGTAGTPQSVVRLEFTSTSADIFSATALVATTTNVGASQNFSVGQIGSLICVQCPGFMYLAGNSSAIGTIQAVIDGTTTYKLGAGIISVNALYCNPFGSGGPIWISGLAVGSHTIQLQLVTNQGGNTAYLRTNTVPTTDWMRLTVTEVAAGGPAGLTWRGAYSAGTAYLMNDAVSDGGASYICIQAGTGHTPASSPTFWSPLSIAGTNGTNGISFIWKGTWSNITAYVPNDVVTFNSATYMAISNSTNQPPNSSPLAWTLMVAAGSMINPMTSVNDLIIGGTSGAPSRLGVGANNRLLGVDNSGVLGYRQATGSDIATSSALSVASLVASGVGTFGGLLTANAGLTVSGALTLPTGSITGTMIADRTIGAVDIASGAITGNEINTGAALNISTISLSGGGNAVYVPSGTVAAASFSTAAGCTVGQLHVSSTTIYGGGNSSTCAAFAYVMFNGAGYKVALYT